MNTQPDFADSAPANSSLDTLNQLASTIGFEIVDIAGFLDSVDEQSKDQLAALGGVRDRVALVLDANKSVRSVVTEMAKISSETLDAVEDSVEAVRASAEQSNHIATWVQALSARMEEVAASLSAVETSNSEIADIARHVNILAINAKIEAARAGDSGRGFGVVAEAINELSQKTAAAAEDIAQKVETLSGWIGVLNAESGTVSEEAGAVLESGAQTNEALRGIAEGARVTDKAAKSIMAEAEKVHDATSSFAPAFSQIDQSARTTGDGIHKARERVNALIDCSEEIVQTTVAAGGVSTDEKFIRKMQQAAQQVAQAFENALDDRRISMAALFDDAYTLIEGTRPEQHTTRFCALTDALCPGIQEPMLDFDPKVVFCAAVDRNGFLPTHNKKFSQPQGADEAWNTANCRNRRIFDDRVGLKAGRNTNPFLLQVYRRDMGGGQFAMMKDLSAPIFVQGRHWGGLRMGYKF